MLSAFRKPISGEGNKTINPPLLINNFIFPIISLNIFFRNIKVMIIVTEMAYSYTPEQAETIKKLNEAATKELELSGKIRNIYNSIRFGYYSNGTSKTVCETPEDAIMLSFGPKRELEKVRKDIREYLEETVSLGLGHLNIIQRNYEIYVRKPLPA